MGTIPGAAITLVDIAEESVNLAKEPTGGFGALKTVLGITSTVHAKVCLEHTVHGSSTNTSVGICHSWKQD